MSGKVFILTTLSILAVSSSEGRQKRIVNGIIIRDRLYSYDAIKYLVWIGYGRSFAERFPELTQEWDPQQETCGGALLTLSIVQTACHCLAQIEDPEKDGFRRAVKKDVTLVVMVGNSEVDSTLSPYPVRYREIHPLCGELHGWLVYDFGILVTLNEFRETARVTYARPYPLADMAEMWSRFTTNLNVCLLMGFGIYLEYNNTISSNVLRHGWQSIMPHHECYLTLERFGLDLTVSKYLESVPVSCIRPLHTHKVVPGSGDSGSPITCDGKYFSVFSQFGGSICGTRVPGQPSVPCSVTMDLIFYAYANSEEFRLPFIKEMLNSQPHKKNLPSFTFTVKYQRYYPPPNFFAAINNAAGHARAIFLPVVLPILFIGHPLQPIE